MQHINPDMEDRLIARKPPLVARPSSGVYRPTGGDKSCRVNHI